MNDRVKGILAIVAACAIWGLSPLYYKLLAHVPPLEVFSHRTGWSVAVFASLLALQGRPGELLRLFASRRSRRLILASTAMVSVNWALFIWSVQAGRVVETSLGYFIQPLVAVFLGYWVLSERLLRSQWAAIALAALAVVILTAGLGVLPWISLILAVTFGLYGLIKKSLSEGPVVTVTAEVLLVAPFSVFWLVAAHRWGWTGFGEGAPGAFGRDWADSLLLAGSALMTATPLALFSYAARRVSLATVGLLQYLNPSLQFVLAVAVFAEPFSPLHGTTFALIWAALALYSAAALRQDRAERRAARAAGTSGTTVM